MKEQNTRGQEMVMDIAFELLKNVDDRETRNWKRVLQTSSTQKETNRIEVKVTFSKFSSKTMKPIFQSSNTHIIEHEVETSRMQAH